MKFGESVSSTSQLQLSKLLFGHFVCIGVSQIFLLLLVDVEESTEEKNLLFCHLETIRILASHLIGRFFKLFLCCSIVKKKIK